MPHDPIRVFAAAACIGLVSALGIFHEDIAEARKAADVPPAPRMLDAQDYEALRDRSALRTRIGALDETCGRGKLRGDMAMHVAFLFGGQAGGAPARATVTVGPEEGAKAVVLVSEGPTVWDVRGPAQAVIVVGGGTLREVPEAAEVLLTEAAPACAARHWVKQPYPVHRPGQSRLIVSEANERASLAARADQITQGIAARRPASWVAQTGQGRFRF